jgi:hypothetical protein
MNKFHTNTKRCSGGICIKAVIFGNALFYFCECGTEEEQLSSVNTPVKIMPLSKPRLEQLLFDSYWHLAKVSTKEFSLHISISRVNYFILSLTCLKI